MLELAFAAYLVFYLPARAMWKSFRPKPEDANKTMSASDHYRVMRWVGTLLLVLGALMVIGGRPIGDLGLDIPLSLYGQWGLMFATALFILMAVGTWIWERGLSAEKRDKYHAEIESHDMVPRTRRDMVTFVALMLLLGAGWELLYRGYLMLVLTPLLGTTGAVIVAAVAYGAAHGYKTRGQFIASIVSAFLFTLGYVLTHSLWWLIVIHILLPLYGTASGYITLRAAGRLAPRPA